MRIILLLLAAVLLCESFCAAETKLQVLDPSKAPFPNVLVIIKYLEDGGESGRYLSDAEGRIPDLQLKAGLYRFILTCPYSICKTTIFEVLGARASGELVLDLPVKSTDEYGLLVGAPRVPLSVVLADHKPFAKAQVLIRNAEASREQWVETDGEGRVDVVLLSDPTIAVIVHRGRVFRYSLSQRCLAPGGSSYADLECHAVARGSIVLELP